MFENGFPREWSTIRKLALLFRSVVNAVVAVLKTIIGNPIHILDALAKPVQALSVKLEPIQDLNGYDNPWPAGGGVNKLPTLSAYDSTYNGIRIQIDNEGKVRLSGTSTEVTSFTFDISEITLPSTDIYIHLMNSVVNSSVGIFFLFDSTSIAGLTAGSLNRIYKSDALTGATINKVRYYVSSGQTVDMTLSPMLCLDGTAKAYAPYSNICPISGHTDADVTRTGKNLLDPSQRTTTSVNAYFYKNTGFLLKAGVTYTFSVYSSEVTAGIYFHKFGTVDNLAVKYNAKSVTYTPTEDVMAWFDAYYFSAPQAGAANVDAQLEVGGTTTAYEEYRGTTYPIPLGQTVYGGQLDVLTGVLTVTWAKSTLNGSEVWAGTPASGWYTQENNLKKLTSYVGHMLADTLPAGAPGENRLYGYIDINNNYPGENWIYYKNSAFTSAVEVDAFFVANPTEVVYELATPQTIQLTPTQVELLLGENNIWSDGEMTLVYLADGNASDVEALNILLGGRYVNNYGEDEPSDREALDILLGGNTR